MNEAARAMLAEADRSIRPGRSLDPERTHARPLAEIGALVPDLTVELAEGLVRVAASVQQYFPDNIFCDLEFLTISLARGARMRESFDRIERLHALFGESTTIRFRYVHDFVYGFDWAKWVRRDPSARRGVGPFDPEFLEHIEQRAHELLALIEKDDATYPQLRDARHRNPFAFSREPEEELRLHRDLAERGLIPVEAWKIDARPRWDLAFADERVARAVALGIAS